MISVPVLVTLGHPLNRSRLVTLLRNCQTKRNLLLFVAASSYATASRVSLTVTGFLTEPLTQSYLVMNLFAQSLQPFALKGNFSLETAVTEIALVLSA